MGCASSAQQATQVVDISKAEFRELGFQQQYDIKHELGEGSFAKVHACVNKKTKAKCAVKVLRPLAEKDAKKAKRELDVWQSLGDHKNIVSLTESYTELTYYFVMPQCKWSLQDMLRAKSDAICDADVFDAFHQVFSGLDHIHSKNVVHRDMKAANVLVDFEGNVKIADFGLSLAKPESGCTGLAGSVPYMSPEMVTAGPYGFETDIWSCGVMMYTLVCGHYPYDATRAYSTTAERRDQIVKSIASNTPAPDYKINDSKSHASPNMRKLIQKLLNRKAPRRPEAETCAKMCLSPMGSSHESALQLPKQLQSQSTAGESSHCPTESTAVESVSYISWESSGTACVEL